jgi:hypothetical protein
MDKSFLRLVPSELDDFESPFSFITQFERHRYQYFTDKDAPKVAIRNFPEICSINAKRLAHKLTESYGRKTGTNPILFYLLETGYNYFKSEGEILDTLALQSRFQASAISTDGDIIEIMSGIFSQLKVSIPYGSSRNFPISVELSGSLTTLSQELGLSKSIFSTLCIMHGLVESPHTYEQHSEQMEAIIDRFISLREKKNTGLEALLNAYGFPVIEEKK